MKKSVFMLLSVVLCTASVFVQKGYSQQKTEKWPGVTERVLLDNENVNITEVTFAPGAVADWHSHPQYTAYALSDVKMKTEVQGKEPVVNEIKAGQAIWSPAVTHKTTNVGKKSFTAIVTEIKNVPHQH